MRRLARTITLHSLASPFLVMVLGLAPVSARAKTVIVHCDDGMNVSNALKTLDPQASNTIRVVGTCTESIRIDDFAQLSIVGVSRLGKHAVIEGLDGQSVLWIVGSHVRIKNLTIRGGQWGVMCRDFSVCRFSGNTIEGAAVRGVELDSADATFEGDVIQNNANEGLAMTAARARVTMVTVKGTQAGPIGDGKGVALNQGSSLTVEQLTVQDNQGAGISLIGASSMNNRFWIGPLTVTNNANGGIWVTAESSGGLGGATVIANRYAGVIITGNSDASFWSGGVFTGNENIDVYCGPLNGIAASPQSATIGVTNCPNTY